MSLAHYIDVEFLQHSQLGTILDQRVCDGVLRRTIDKWLAAGVMEGMQLSHPDAGTPQGGVVSPMLANVYLHDALDKWFERDARPRLRGRARMVRYADDLVMVFTNEKDARRVLDVLPKRLGKYGLTLHPTKTRLLYFRPPSAGGNQTRATGKQSFDFLGFTHHWARSRRGLWVVMRKTAGGRFGRALKRASEWLRSVRHQPLAQQHEQLVRKLTRSQQLLWIAWQLRGVVPIPLRSWPALAEVARPPLRQSLHDVGAFQSSLETLSTPEPGRPVWARASRSKPVTCPGPPGKSACSPIHHSAKLLLELVELMGIEPMTS